MARLTAVFLALASAFAAPAAAEEPGRAAAVMLPSFGAGADGDPLKLERRGFSFPIVEFTEPDGTRSKRRGIIAGTEVAPGTLIGIGLFETIPKVRGYAPEQSPTAPPKRKRRAALGVTMKF